MRERAARGRDKRNGRERKTRDRARVGAVRLARRERTEKSRRGEDGEG